jgi:hypothetical protein
MLGEVKNLKGQKYRLYYYDGSGLVRYQSHIEGVECEYLDRDEALEAFKRASNLSNKQVVLVSDKPFRRIIGIKFYEED